MPQFCSCCARLDLIVYDVVYKYLEFSSTLAVWTRSILYCIAYFHVLYQYITLSTRALMFIVDYNLF